MSTSSGQSLSILFDRFVKARAKVLAREDREMKLNLIQVRHSAGLSQRQVAEIMGISQQAVQKLERYDSDPKLSTLRRYANAIGALVSHQVTQDLGQSVWLAAASRWDASVVLSSQDVSATKTIGAPIGGNAWQKDSNKRNEYALAG